MTITTELSRQLMEMGDEELADELTRPARIEYMLLVNNIGLNRILTKMLDREARHKATRTYDDADPP